MEFIQMNLYKICWRTSGVKNMLDETDSKSDIAEEKTNEYKVRTGNYPK